MGEAHMQLDLPKLSKTELKKNVWLSYNYYENEIAQYLAKEAIQEQKIGPSCCHDS